MASILGLFGRSEDEHERLRATVRSLGVTSVPGLAAALAWRERKTERLLGHELSRPDTPLLYEPGRRLVRWRLPPAESPAASPASAPAPPVTGAARSGGYQPHRLLRGTTLKVVCPSCRVALMHTGSGMLAVCPQCGRLSSEKAPAPPSSPAPAPVGATPAEPVPSAARDAPPHAQREGDLKSQELFAAYVTSRPIPCPRCRTALRHRGVGEYACPSCGQAVRFGGTSEAGPAVQVPSG